MNIRTRLVAAFSVMALIMLMLGAVSIYALQLVNQNGNEMYEQRVLPNAILMDITRLAENTRVQMVSAALYENPELTQSAENNMGRIDELIASYKEAGVHGSEVDMVANFEASWTKFTDAVKTDIALIEERQFEEAEKGLQSSGTLFAVAQGNLLQLKIRNEEKAAELDETNGKIYEANRNLVIGIGIAALILAIGLGAFMGQRIGRAVKMASSRMEQITEGDLTGEPLVSKRRDEIGNLIRAENKMQEQLAEVIRKINEATAHVTAQSEELTQSSNEVREGSEQIAVTMQELASGSEAQANHSADLSEKMDGFAAKVHEMNQQNREITERSESVIKNAEEGSEMMEASVHQMMVIDQVMALSVEKVKGLDQQTNEISKLVNVIRDVAEQTNLLALNAAIEAARAGENGKGFAVVADEVRKLAEQVSKSVSEITGFVGGIQRESREVVESLEKGYQEVNDGTQKIAGTGEKFSEIHRSIESMIGKIADVSVSLASINEDSQVMNASIQEIASVSEEAAAGIEETAASSQQSLSTMETISASADELAKLAEDLSEEVKRFKVIPTE
ncbi:methyl-accepting chemotaxis protein [Jeotgalibacillus sp. R-1-5s-1]|uniref:methyl-accepting chemotaxis protein n=1 Tax=Jeotgalibacillus sp. R-1-5s-1 TaxID=2555897 RepID=UPI00106D6FEE|nr:HAMP domain-containing methyl-accepting chemotaxis protein [Jeotgalibacillus sp. R-1-5s-1]TFD95806.1 methyl-accepting chemotaxis protein [Jeotgalibacillus sp. R-1-5s-1]